MYRVFATQSHQVLGKSEEAYPQRYVTELLTKQVVTLRSNPPGGGILATARCCNLGHIAHYAPAVAPRSVAKMLAAIGTATSFEAP